MSDSSGRFPWDALIAIVLLIGLFEYLFFVPLRPAAWAGPREAGPFEASELPSSGRWARDVRLWLESLAKWRSPNRPLDATAAALAGFHATLAAARFGILFFILRRLGAKDWLAALGVLAAAMPIFLGGPRQTPADVGLLLFALLILVTTSPRPSWRTILIGIPLLFAFWANAHASVSVGLAWLGVVAIGRTIEWWKGRNNEGPVSPAVGRLLVAIVLAAGAACANPDGPRLFIDAFVQLKNPNLHSISAWRPIDFTKPAGMPWVYFASIAALFLTQLFSSRAFSPLALAVILTFGIWPLVQQRGSDYWWLIVVWLLVPQIVSIIDRIRSRCDSFDTDKSSCCEGKLKWVILVIVAIAILVTPAARWFISGSPRSLETITSQDTPVRVARELTADDDAAGRFLPELREQVRLTYPNQRYRGAILAGPEQGDFLAWVLDGDNNQPVMVYSRPETLDVAHWGEAFRALDGESPWWEIVDRHQVNLIVIDPGRFTRLAERLRMAKEWRTLQDDGPGGLFVSVRREPKLPVELMAP